MKFHFLSFAFGFIAACVAGLGGIVALLFIGTSDIASTYHEHRLPSGTTIKVTMCNLAWGIDHSDRYADQDCFLLEYVASSPHPDQQSKDRETLEVFELIRPLSEQWGFQRAEVLAFPTIRRRGLYDVYAFNQDSAGRWSYERRTQKVHIND
jgi:hypothetical protein